MSIKLVPTGKPSMLAANISMNTIDKLDVHRVPEETEIRVPSSGSKIRFHGQSGLLIFAVICGLEGEPRFQSQWLYCRISYIYRCLSLQYDIHCIKVL